MAQTIKHRRGPVEAVKNIAGFANGEIIVASGSVGHIANDTFVYVGRPGPNDNAYAPISKIYMGNGAPIESTTLTNTHGTTLNGLPYYDYTNNRFYVLNSGGHTEITFTSESIENFTSDVITLIQQNATSVDITDLNNFTSSINTWTGSINTSIDTLQQGIAFWTGSGIATSITAGVTASFTSSGAGLWADITGTTVTYSIGDGADFLLGEATTGLNQESADSTIYTAINNIDTILSLLAPPKPVNLSAVTPVASKTTYSAKKPDNTTLTGVYLNTTTRQIYEFDAAGAAGSEGGFWDGKTGTLTAQVWSSDNGYQTVGSKTLTANDDTGTYNDEATAFGGVYAGSRLQISQDIDYWDGTEGKLGFWDSLAASVSASFTSSGDATDPIQFKVKLEHSETGAKESSVFYVSTPVATIITNKGASYDETVNGFHYQSGIKYIGYLDTVTGSYTVEIPANTQLINSSGNIGRVDSDYTTGATKTVTTWTAGNTYNVSASLSVDDTKFLNGTALQFTYTPYRWGSSPTATTSTLNLASNVMLDSKKEDETNPGGSSTRVGSGTGQFPTADIGGTGPSANFGTTFSSQTLLTATNHAELRYANEYFLWPSIVDYSSYTPPGPDYSQVDNTGVDSYNNMRWATFNLGSVSAVNSILLNFNSKSGFDGTGLNAVQTTDGFEMYVKVVGANGTYWIDANSPWASGSPGNTSDGDGGFIASESGADSRYITFGTIARTGDVYVRVGWKIGGGTDPTSSSTRRFKYITLA